MVKLDEHAIVPPIEAESVRRLSELLDVDGVVAAYLFGSQARGTAGPLSDVDIAVWFRPGLTAHERHDRRVALTEAAISVLGTTEIDVVPLNDAPPTLRHDVVCDGLRLLDRAPRARLELEVASELEYLDTAHLRAEMRRGLRHLISEGRFGRA